MHTQRLQKFLAQSGLGSRRKMDYMISQGVVEVNGVTAVVGQKVNQADVVTVNGKVIDADLWGAIPRILLYNKPEGEIVSRKDPYGRSSVFDKLPVLANSKWVSVGRLDFNTSGLLIFTTSGELVNKMIHPRFKVQREYFMRVNKYLSKEQLEKLLIGIVLEDGLGCFESIKYQRGKKNNVWYSVIVSEGRNRFVRRMIAALGLEVTRLKRVRVGDLVLPEKLTKRSYHELNVKQVKAILGKFVLSP